MNRQEATSPGSPTSPSAVRLDGLAQAFVRTGPVIIIAVFALAVAAILLAAGDSLGYDFLAYVRAAPHLVDGGVLYDPNAGAAGPFGVFYYPPPFALVVLPFSALPEWAAIDAWIAAMLAAFLVGVALLPVSRGVRWAVVLLAALQWPFLYTIKLGQVTPLLFLVFAAGWRWLDRQDRVGIAAGIGTMIKVQPALLLGWMVAKGRWRALAASLVTLAVLALLATLVGGSHVWPDFVSILTRVSRPVTTAHNFTPGAVAFQSGADEATAGLIQWAWLAAVGLVTVFAWLRADPEAAYVITAVASQAVSPLLWDHYAMILLLPVAFLLERRQWWAVVIPLVSWSFVPVLIPVLFAASMLAVILVPGERGAARRAPRTAS